jgi:hypothetical protein
MSSGFITNYIQQSNGTFDGTLNTLDSSGNTTTIYLSNVNLIINNWCLISPNNIDQILIMTNDNKYIYVPSIPFIMSNKSNTFYTAIISLCIDYYIIKLSTPSTSVITFGADIGIPPQNNSLKTLKNSAQLAMYIYIYFFINNGIESFTAANNIMTILDKSTITSLNKDDPNYSTWIKLRNDTKYERFINQLFLIYAICMNSKTYIRILDPYDSLPVNITDSNWKYVANFIKTIYQMYSYDASNFCINLSANSTYITNKNSLSPSSTLYIPESIDCRTISLNATDNINSPISLCNKTSINTKITYTPAQVASMNNNFLGLASSCSVLIILIIIGLIIWYFSTKDSNIKKSGNDYYYI